MSNEKLRRIPASGRASGIGCLRGLIVISVIAVVLVVGTIVVIDLTDSGEKVKDGMVEMVEAASGTSEDGAAAPTEPVSTTGTDDAALRNELDQARSDLAKAREQLKASEAKITELEKQDPLPERFLSRRTIDTVDLWNGLRVESGVTTEEGELATTERESEEGFELGLEMKLTVPEPGTTVEDLARLNPELPKQLPELDRLLQNGKVSPFFYGLYEAKAKRIQQYLTRFDRILSRHNYFDCETILELSHPDTGQRALLIQSEMDVVSDGSDGDRWPKLDQYISMSDNYQYSTSYAWPKQTSTPNPLLRAREAELRKKEARFAVTGLSIEENRQLRADIARLTAEVAEMKSRSFLIAEADPFIVIPLSLLGRFDETPFGPKIGDYAVVFYEGRAFPAIAGDAGPSFQAGEASLRMAKALNEEAGVYSRPESDLKVTYLVFPQSAEERKSAPDLDHWWDTCSHLLDRVGGLGEGYELHRWEDLIAKKGGKTPTPSPAPAEESPTVPSEADRGAPSSSGPPREVRPLSSGREEGGAR